jgi:hypothetical protein
MVAAPALDVFFKQTQGIKVGVSIFGGRTLRCDLVGQVQQVASAIPVTIRVDRIGNAKVRKLELLMSMRDQDVRLAGYLALVSELWQVEEWRVADACVLTEDDIPRLVHRISDLADSDD